MKIFRKAQILEMAESYIFCVKSHADHDAAIENCDHYLLSYKLLFIHKMPSKMRSKNLFLTQFLESRCGPTATVTSLKLTLDEGPDQVVLGKRLGGRK